MWLQTPAVPEKGKGNGYQEGPGKEGSRQEDDDCQEDDRQEEVSRRRAHCPLTTARGREPRDLSWARRQS